MPFIVNGRATALTWLCCDLFKLESYRKDPQQTWIVKRERDCQLGSWARGVCGLWGGGGGWGGREGGGERRDRGGGVALIQRANR